MFTCRDGKGGELSSQASRMLYKPPGARSGLYLALINRARGLHGRILTEVVSTDRTQWDLCTWPRPRFSHTDRLTSVNKTFIIWRKQEQFNSFNVTGLYWHFASERPGAEFHSSKFCSSSLLFFLVSFLSLTEINIVRWTQSMVLHFSLQLFHLRTFPV